MQIATEQRLILGAPGCGKTTRLLGIMEEELARGVSPARIAYVSFTRQAVNEAVTRAEQRFGVTHKDLPYFRTLHSVCFREQGLSRNDVIGKAHYSELGSRLGYTFNSNKLNPDDGMPNASDEGDRLLFTVNLARGRRVSLEEQWHDLNDYDMDLFALRRVAAELQEYKRETGVLDFQDMLDETVRTGVRLPVEVAIIDEAQDLTATQWAVCQTLFRDAHRVYVGGDDDQCIHKWGGADVDMFLALAGEREVLQKSYRLPQSVYDIALRTVGRISHRFAKTWHPRDEAGAVHVLPHVEAVDWDAHPGTWMVLARNGYFLSEVELLLRNAGKLYYRRDGERSVSEDHYIAIQTWERLRRGETAPAAHVRIMYDYMRPGGSLQRGAKGNAAFDDAHHYTMQELRDRYGVQTKEMWHDALDGIALDTREYYRLVLRSGEKLNTEPRIRVGTIHSVKGGEADNVVLMTDISWRTFQNYQKMPDDEHRVFYVGITRARHNLYLIDARSPQAYDL